MRVNVNLFDSFIENIIYFIERKVKVSGLLESLEIMNNAYCRLGVIAWHFFPYKLQSLLNNRRRI